MFASCLEKDVFADLMISVATLVCMETLTCDTWVKLGLTSRYLGSLKPFKNFNLSYSSLHFLNLYYKYMILGTKTHEHNLVRLFINFIPVIGLFAYLMVLVSS